MRGVVVGKFYPPHKGHNYLIDTALKNCDEVDVLVVDNPSYHVPTALRQQWIKAAHPRAHVHIIPDLYDDDNSQGWALHTLRFLGYTPDVVYSSETYGKTWAEAMGCKHVDVDISRHTVPISGTKVRQDIIKSWPYLNDYTRAGLAIRIVVLGAESTGTTTLSRDLAKALNAPWVPEVGRYYTESILTTTNEWNDEDFYRIGRLQQAYESEISARSDGVVVCDTNAVATELWQRRYMGKITAPMKVIAARDKADLYIITGDEIPFVQDGLRDGEHIRHAMHRWFINHIRRTNVPYIVATGSQTDRLKQALKAAKDAIKDNRIIK